MLNEEKLIFFWYILLYYDEGKPKVSITHNNQDGFIPRKGCELFLGELHTTSSKEYVGEVFSDDNHIDFLNSIRIFEDSVQTSFLTELLNGLVNEVLDQALSGNEFSTYTDNTLFGLISQLDTILKSEEVTKTLTEICKMVYDYGLSLNVQTSLAVN